MTQQWAAPGVQQALLQQSTPSGQQTVPRAQHGLPQHSPVAQQNSLLAEQQTGPGPQ
jgi:hypothetical protein